MGENDSAYGVTRDDLEANMGQRQFQERFQDREKSVESGTQTGGYLDE